MVKSVGKMICPHCGEEMNHHGDKLLYATDPQPSGLDDLTMGGFIEEFHTCPQCGAGASRRDQSL
jgi:ribosomal protein S27AE